MIILEDSKTFDDLANKLRHKSYSLPILIARYLNARNTTAALVYLSGTQVFVYLYVNYRFHSIKHRHRIEAALE